MEYKKPKGLKIRKIDTSKVKAKKAPSQAPKGALAPVKPKLKLKRATIPVPSMTSGPGKATKTTKKAKGKKKATTGKVTYRKGGMSKPKDADRAKLEVKSEIEGSNIVKKLRLKQRMKTNKKLKGYK